MLIESLTSKCSVNALSVELHIQPTSQTMILSRLTPFRRPLDLQMMIRISMNFVAKMTRILLEAQDPQTSGVRAATLRKQPNLLFDLGPSCGHLVAFWGHLGVSWGHRGAMLRCFVAILGYLGATSGHLGASWGFWRSKCKPYKT